MNSTLACTRREFVRQGLGLVGLGATVPTFLSQTVSALGAQGSDLGGKDGRILVVVQLAGGNDGLNTVVPYRNDAYYRSRPRLAIRASDVLKVDDDLGFHPQARGLKQLWDDGRLGVVHGVGYPNPNRSHFVGTRIWHTASPEGRLHDGWLGRYFDAACKGNDCPDSREGIALVDETPLAMRGEKFQPISVSNPQNWVYRGAERIQALTGGESESKGKARGRSGALDFLRRSTLDTAVAAEEIRAAARTAIDGARFPTGRFAQSLRSVARMIAAGMETKVYYVSQTGFDTHANQAGRHGQLLRELGTGLAAFVDALRRTENLERTLVMTFSEFGRRVVENGSGGTDHGEAAPMFLLGGNARPGFFGSIPSLDKLHRGDLAYHTDFRRVYATVLRDWLGADAKAIVGRSFKPLPLLGAASG